MSNYLQIANPHPQDIKHVTSILDTFPKRWAFGFARKYQQLAKKEGRRAANLYLIDKKDTIKPHSIGLASNDEEICNLAKEKARRYSEDLATATVIYKGVTIESRDYGDGRGLLPLIDTAKGERVVMSGVCFMAKFYKISNEIKLIGVKPPTVKKDSDYELLCNRFKDVKWWRRALRVAIGRHVEAEAIKAGFVGFRASYCSNETVERRRQQNRRNTELLKWIQAENDSGYKCTLADLSAAGVANPENRKNELMTRIRGVEEEAKRKGFQCEFLTITCPSKYHATRYLKKQNKRISNPKYEGYTPKEAQEYLVKIWSQIRAELNRNSIKPVGFRVAEPHKDGCPHWHLMLFIDKRHSDLMWRIVRRYACKEEAGELKTAAALGARFDRVVIDPSKGSAAGYIAKYIAKNIDMGGLDDFENHEGGSTKDGLERSVAWAATWGIRQFQQIGGERITVWRELRRIREGEDLPEVVAVLWRAADAGEYGQFLKEAEARKITLIREEEKESPLYDTTYAPNDKGVFDVVKRVDVGSVVSGFFNRYGEQVAGFIKGLNVDGVDILTRFNTWVFSMIERPDFLTTNKARSGLLGLV